MQHLAGRDYVLVVDCSGSMMTEDCENFNSRWNDAKEGAIAFASTMDRLDPDGIDLCFFNDTDFWLRNVHQADVENAFMERAPRGGTVLSPVLETIFLEWFDKRGTKQGRPLSIVVVTDGMPSDKEQVIQTIVTASQRLKAEGGRDEELALQLIQIGTDAGATRFLKELDDDLQRKYHAAFDLVDTTPFTEVTRRGGLRQALLNAIND